MSEGPWEKLAQVTVKGAEHDSRERLPHPQCLEGTRVDLLKYIYGVLDDRSKSRLIWLHGTAGVGKSAVAFTVAERMRGLKVTEETNVEMRLAGTFFFSRKHTNRRTTGLLFATLAYQLASNFPSVRTHVNKAILENPALLHPDGSLRKQMEVLFSRPLRQLKSRLRGCPPLAFVIDALDECTESFDQSAPESFDQSTIEPFDENKSEIELAELISLLAQALRDPDLPVTHILVTSRSEAHIHEAMQHEDVHPLVCEIPVKISGHGVATTISLDGADVDEDIYVFLQHSFRKLRSRFPTFPQPTKVQLERLANRAGRRFIVASTMMKFIDDRHSDPYERLELMLGLASDLLPGTEVYKLYDRILSTCADPTQAYLHLSVVAALSDPLPMSQISELLGPGEGRDVERVLVQLRSVIDVPTDHSLPVNIYHSSVRDYVSHPSNCSLPQVKHIISPHSLLALSSLRLIRREIPGSTALFDALSELNKHSQAMKSCDPQNLKHALAFTVQPPEPLQVLITLLWLRGHRDSELNFWLETQDGRAWLQTDGAKDWLLTQHGNNWLQTQGGEDWLQTQGGEDWLRTQGGKEWLQTQAGEDWLQTQGGKDWLQTQAGEDWLQTQSGEDWLQTQGGKDWLQTQGGRDWLGTRSGRNWLQTQAGRDWLGTRSGRDWLWTQAGEDWLWTQGGRNWLWTQGGRDWLQTQAEEDWLQTHDKDWLQTKGGRDWLGTRSGRNWLWTQAGKDWLRTQARRDWLRTQAGRDWLQTHGRDWLRTQGGKDWLQTQGREDRLQTQGREDRLHIPDEGKWPDTVYRLWLQTSDFVPPQREEGRRDGLGGERRVDWLWQNPDGWHWLQTLGGREWLQYQGGYKWLQSTGWLQSMGGRNWLQSSGGQDWLQTQGGRDWLRTREGQDWLRTREGQDWLQTLDGKAWRLTSVWVTIEEFSSTLEATREYGIIAASPSQLALQVVQQFKNLPDFLMFLVFLALRNPDHATSAILQHRVPLDMEIIHAIMAFMSFAYEAWKRSRSISEALKYACQNWAVHLSRTPIPWSESLTHTFKNFWNHSLLSWLETQWCLKDLQSCLTILSAGHKLAEDHLQFPGSSY